MVMGEESAYVHAERRGIAVFLISREGDAFAERVSPAFTPYLANSKYFVMTETYTQQKEHYDIIVIGAGPAGEAAAMNAKKKGFSVAVVTDEAKVGGSCTIGQRSRRRRCVTR